MHIQINLLSDLFNCNYASLWPLLLRRDRLRFAFKKPNLHHAFDDLKIGGGGGGGYNDVRLNMMRMARAQQGCQSSAPRVAKVIRMRLEDAR